MYISLCPFLPLIILFFFFHRGDWTLSQGRRQNTLPVLSPWTQEECPASPMLLSFGVRDLRPNSACTPKLPHWPSQRTLRVGHQSLPFPLGFLGPQLKMARRLCIGLHPLAPRGGFGPANATATFPCLTQSQRDRSSPALRLLCTWFLINANPTPYLHMPATSSLKFWNHTSSIPG